MTLAGFFTYLFSRNLKISKTGSVNGNVAWNIQDIRGYEIIKINRYIKENIALFLIITQNHFFTLYT